MQINSINIFPHLHLLVSGGHTQIFYCESWGEKKIIGQTLDDAAGESFDKIGRMLGLSYPGGVKLAKIAKLETENSANLPISMNTSQGFNFSYSGLKTSVRYICQNHSKYKLIEPLLTPNEFEFEREISPSELETLLKMTSSTKLKTLSPKLRFIYKMCVSSQYVIVKQLVNQFTKAIQSNSSLKSIGISGGVSANLLLREEMQKLVYQFGLDNIFIPPLKLTGDNGVMIGLAGILDM